MKSSKGFTGKRRTGKAFDVAGRRRHICWLCTALTVCALLIVGIVHSWTVKSRRSLDVVPLSVPRVSDLRTCMYCNPDMAKFSRRNGRRQGKDESLLAYKFLPGNEKFIYYAPHSGFSNQVIELKNALVFAKLLNRTLVIPPVLDHHEAWLGSCPKKRVLRPHRLRALVWSRISNLISSSRYISLADIVDISSVSPSKVKTIDLRIFLALWCGVDIKNSCGGDLCKNFAEEFFAWGELKGCIQSLNPVPQEEQQCCVYGVEDDCTSTIWTNSLRLYDDTASESVHSPKSKLQRRFPEVGNMSRKQSSQSQAVRRRALLVTRTSNEWKLEKINVSKKKISDITNSLGPDSSVGSYTILAFGSMFSTNYKGVQSYINILSPSGDKDLDELIRLLKLLPFSSDIVAAGQKYIREEVTQPFYCAQVRLMDGQFKNHWNITFRNLRAKLLSYNSSYRPREPLHMFLMTDLPSENWTGTGLEEFTNSRSLYHVYNLDGRDEIIQKASRLVMEAESGFLVGSELHTVGRTRKTKTDLTSNNPHVRLAMEEVVCGCASLGFSGTQGSTIADSIRDLKATAICNG